MTGSSAANFATNSVAGSQEPAGGGVGGQPVPGHAGPDRSAGHWAATVPIGIGTDPDAISAQLWAAGAQGVWQRPGELVGYFPSPPDELDPDRLANLPDTTWWAHEPAVDHVAAWRAAARPVRAGATEIVPTHLADQHETPAGVHRILLDPGQAFGSGHHATTSGCLEVLEDIDPAGRRVLDLGTGTGILAIAAAKQGAATVLALDTDPHAVAVARDNAHANDVAPDFAVGTLANLTDRFDVVLANLLTTTLVDLARDFPRVMAPGGWLVASGVGRERAHVVRDAFTQAGLADVAVRPRDDWVVLTARPPGRPA